MNVIRTNKNGATVDTIFLRREENSAIDNAHEIINERFDEEDIVLSKQEIECLDFLFQGIVFREGVEALAKYVKTVPIRKKSSETRGYC